MSIIPGDGAGENTAHEPLLLYQASFLMLIIICQAHLLVDPITIPLMYNLKLWNNFLKKN